MSKGRRMDEYIEVMSFEVMSLMYPLEVDVVKHA